MKKYVQLYQTIKYLKKEQIYYRIYYVMRNKYRRLTNFTYPHVSSSIKINKLVLQSSINAYSSYENNTFKFLNLSHSFDSKIDWNYSEHGKLWTYNLNYFEFLNQKNFTKEEGLFLIHNYISNEKALKDGLEAFPISLRTINWIKFMEKHDINIPKINTILYKHYQILLDNLEYHLQGNHLLENAFSLLFGAYYFQDDTLYFQAKTNLENELKKQILDDGAHYELSPMYHQLMLFRLLDSINLVQNNNYQQQELLNLLKITASKMLAWLQVISYKDGSIPLLNDSAKGIAPSSQELFNYAKELNIPFDSIKLSDSGYRKINKEAYECIVDIGAIGPNHIPGHAHADTFNFELKINNKPFIVDTGISTYEKNHKRDLERSTIAHNTVTILNKSSSKTWSSFRVANRAFITNIRESKNQIIAVHNGYQKNFKTLHERQWQFQETGIIIRDTLSSNTTAIVRLHFHPNVQQESITNHINLKSLKFNFKLYEYASEFNKSIEAYLLEIEFNKTINIEINI